MLQKNNRAVFLDVSTLGEVDLSPISLILDEFISYERTKPEDVVDRCIGYPILITNKVPISREDLANLPDLRLICVAATGINNIDLDACREMKILVKNVKDYSTDSVAQFTFNLLFHVLHSNTYHGDYTAGGDWAISPIFTHLKKPFYELRGKTWGIVGLGKIGQRVAEIAKVFGCHVIYTSTTGKNKNDNWEQVDLKKLMETSDIISLHCNLTPETEGLINYDVLKLTKRNPILINVARGPIVDEEEVGQALKEGRLKFYATDVMFFEPPQRSHLFFTDFDIKPKVYVSPHIAWSSIEARRRLVEGIRKNILESLL
jgi:lactate dehydrogenase-like 2-hydroxyacid dehydrogenase